MTPNERLAAYRLARRFSFDSINGSLTRQNATTNGRPFRIARWHALEAGEPILQEEAPFIAKMFGLTLLQFEAVLRGENARPFLSEGWPTEFGAGLRAKRMAARLTQVQLAEKSGIPQSFISNLEKRPKLPSLGVLEKLARGLGVKWETFVPDSLLAEYRAKYASVVEDQALLDDLADVL